MPVVIRRALLIVLLTLPWLWPHTYGPSAGAEPYLVCALMAAIALALWPARDVALGVRIAAWALLAAALLSSVIALLQYFNLEASLNSKVSALFEYFNLEAPRYPLINIAEPGQAFGNLRQPNQLATLLVMGALALLWLARDRRLPWGLALAPGALLVAALAATAARVGMSELLVCGALLLWWAVWSAVNAEGKERWRPVLLAVGGAVALYVLAVLVLPLLAHSTEGIAGRDLVVRLRTAENTCGSRFILYSNVLHLIGLKPWTGWGWGELAYAHYITLYDGPRFCHILDNAHNLPLHLAVELGVPAALLAGALVAWLIWRGRPWAELQPTRQLAWSVLLAIGIHSLVEYPLWYGPFQLTAVICVWLLWATRASAGTDAPAAWLAWGRYAIAAAMLGAVLYASWDYHRISQIYLPADERSPAYRYDSMEQARKSWLYADVVRFAEVTSRPATRDNAAWMLPAALKTLHFSPEPRVIEKVIESATLLGRDDLALAHLARFRAAFPRQHRQWVDDNERMLSGAQELLHSAKAASGGR